MKGDFNFNKFTKFLKSFWGILASFTAILPTIIYFTNTVQIKNSILSEYYVAIPTTFSLLAIPFIFLYEDKLSDLKIIRKLSIIFISLSFILLFSFLTVKNLYIVDKEYTEIKANENLLIKETAQGVIEKSTLDKIHNNTKNEILINEMELVSLILFTLSIIFLTVSFSGLGVFFYTKSEE